MTTNKKQGSIVSPFSRICNTRSAIFGTALPVLSEFSRINSLQKHYLLEDEEEYKNKISPTKIVCTLANSTYPREFISKMIDEGMSGARFNMSYENFEQIEKAVALIKSVSGEKRRFCAIILDTRGCSVRTTRVEGRGVPVRKDAIIEIGRTRERGEICTSEKIFFNHPEVLEHLVVGDKITLGIGKLELSVEETGGRSAKCRFTTNGILNSYDRVFLPKGKGKVKKCTQEIEEDIDLAIKVNADFVATSYVSKPSDVKEIRQILSKRNSSHIKIIAKIDCELALRNFEKLLAESDGIYVSRGSMGEEIDLEAVNIAQKLIVQKCNAAGKPAIVAKQMLDSMRENPFPTRAEASEVGNAVFDGADCLCLNGETAVGSFPVESVRMMATICKESERSVNHEETFRVVYEKCVGCEAGLAPLEAVASSAVKMSFDIKASVLIAFSKTGRMGRLLSKYRPKSIILMITDSETSAKQAALLRGVLPLLVTSFKENDAVAHFALETAKKLIICKAGDLAVVAKSDPGLVKVLTVQVEN